MKITDEVALQTQTWFLTAFVEKTREQLNRNISPEAALGLKRSGSPPQYKYCNFLSSSPPGGGG